MNNFIKIKNLYKIFGNNTTEALNLVKTGISKEKLLEKTNCVLGLNNINPVSYTHLTLPTKA